QQILRQRQRQIFAWLQIAARALIGEADNLLADPTLDDLLKSIECASADEQDIRRVDLDEFLMRMLASALRRNRGYSAFQYFEQRLLNAFSGYIARNRWILGLARYLINLIDIDNPALSLLHVIVSSLNQLKQNILNILAHIASFRQGSSIRDRERHIQNLG